MKLNMILFILGLTFWMWAGNTGKISGIVKDNKTEERLAGVNINIPGTQIGSMTDIDGYFITLNVPVGIYTVEVNTPGHKSVKIDSVIVFADSVTQLEIALIEEPIDDSANIHPSPETESKPDLIANVEELKHTIITPHLKQQLTSGTNVLWCSTFQLAWNELCDLAGGPINMDPTPSIVPILNNRSISKKDLDENSYIVTAGLASDGIYEKFQEEFKRKFQGKLPPVSKPPMQGVGAYAYLFKTLPFKWVFDRIPENLLFEGYYVDSFGFSELRGVHKDSMASQIAILDYNNQDELIIELKTQAKDDKLILAKVQPKATLGETINMVEKRIQKVKPMPMQRGETFFVPVLNFEIVRKYSELYGLTIQTANKQLHRQKIVSANQWIRFQLDEKGAMLISAVDIVTSGKVREYVFDKPFLILLRRREAKNPYFALWVGNAELLVPVQKKSLEDKKRFFPD